MLSPTPRGDHPMELSAPKTITFLISVIVAIIAIVIRYLTHHANINLPHVPSGFVVLLVSYLILVAGNVLRGI
jgi:hypothetical protein